MDRRRFVLRISAGVAMAPFPALGASWRMQRTPYGAPDLEGVWTNASYTHLERPKEFKSLVVGPAEARAFEAARAAHHGVLLVGDEVGQADSEFPESGAGLARIHGEIRSSWIVDPPDGKLPYTPEARKRLHLDEHPRPEHYDGPEQRPQMERCLNTTGSAPITSSPDASLFQIVQTRDAVVILAEKNHDARIVRLTSGAVMTKGPPSWMGDSVGRWEGETLVVETDNFLPEIEQRENSFFLSSQAKVTERFTRTGPGEMIYAFSVTDPKMFTQTWRGEMLFTAAKGPLYEYACHEGNYSIVTILEAARAGRQDQAAVPLQARAGVLPIKR